MTEKGLSQTEKILRHLKVFGSITPLEAMEQYGIMRLAARVADLKAAGVAIHTEDVRSKNRFGEPTRYAKYSLMEEKQ